MGLFRNLYNSIFRTYTKVDLSKWEHNPQLDKPIYGVYHIMMDNGWEPIAEAQVHSLKQSGLLAVSKKLYISCISSSEANVEKLKKMLNSDNVEVIAFHKEPKRYEYPALEFIRELSLREDAFVYYFHSKRISYQSVDSTDRRFLSFRRKIDAWRELLEYFVFDKWQVAVNALSAGYDTYGCYRWPPKNYKMYSGSFWWGRTDFIRTLPAFDPKVIAHDRFYSEIWLFEQPNRQFSAFDSIVDFYFVRVPRSIYAEAHPPLTDLIRFVFTYNLRKIAKHIFGYNYKQVNQKRFQQLRDSIS